MAGQTNRRKGHDLERLLARIFRDEFGFKYCRTTRRESKLLDDCGIDLANVPMLVQAKCGYARNHPKYKDIYRYIKQNIKENFPPDHEIHSVPIVLIHKVDGKTPENFTWEFAHDDIVPLLKEYYELKLASLSD